MPCACQNKRQQYEVVTEAGKVVFTSGSKPTAETVARRYAGSTVREKAKAGTTK
ncbi:hypothetical protein PH213_20330 [Streptomyces sp. SRF1]|uniref:hypothetical protein n=1 Tax=Streptomyces TaxID=1883 RepID=UPI0025AF780C|nr:hypothetical protein [Streptomyces sp. SRF1]MDN3056854.1 hypothetical protein [Streptomyces sp. SRF1]